MFVAVKPHRNGFVVDEQGTGGPVYRSRMNQQWRQRIRGTVRWHNAETTAQVYITDTSAFVHHDALSRLNKRA